METSTNLTLIRNLLKPIYCFSKKNDMGFMANGMKSVKENNRVRSKKISKFSHGRFSKENSTSNSNFSIVKSPTDQKPNNLSRRNADLNYLLLVSILTSILMFYTYQVINGWTLDYTGSYKERMRRLSEANPQATYDLIIQRAYDKYDRKEYSEAEIHFRKALSYFPHDKFAHIGLTKSLIKKCIHNSRNCNYAFLYYNWLCSAKQLNQYETADLNYVITSESH